MNELLQSAEFWVAVSFVIFVVAIFRPARRALTAALDQRIGHIRDEVEEAQKLREEAQSALASYQRRQREAIKEAENIIAHAREEAGRAKIQAEAELKESIARREQQAVEKIARAEDAAMAEIRDRAVELAIAATGRLLAEKMAGKAGDAAVSAAIKELPDKLN